MGLTYNTYLDGNSVYGCKNCKAHLANNEDIISKVSLIINMPITTYPPLSTIPHSYIQLAKRPPDSRNPRTSAANTEKPTSSTQSSTSRRASPTSAA